ncbi:MAG: AMP-binding protein, partial [Actinomycetes bacterium]
MASTTKAREKLPPPSDSLGQMLIERIAATPDREAFRSPGEGDVWNSLTWKQAGDDIFELAAGLLSLGVELEQRVGIAADTSLEWILADLAVALAGGAVTTVYSSTDAGDVAYILGDSDTRVLFAENEKQLAKVRQEREQLPDLRKVILFHGAGTAADGDWVITLDDLRALGKEKLAADPVCVTERAGQVTADTLATLIYTSGTTGKPKGVELTQGNWGYIGAALDGLGVLNIDDVQFLWLPLAHVFGSVLVAVHLRVGFVTAIDGRVPQLVANLPVVKPTFMAGVPRIFEKVYAGANAK